MAHNSATLLDRRGPVRRRDWERPQREIHAEPAEQKGRPLWRAEPSVQTWDQSEGMRRGRAMDTWGEGEYGLKKRGLAAQLPNRSLRARRDWLPSRMRAQP